MMQDVQVELDGRRFGVPWRAYNQHRADAILAAATEAGILAPGDYMLSDLAGNTFAGETLVDITKVRQFIALDRGAGPAA